VSRGDLARAPHSSYVAGVVEAALSAFDEKAGLDPVVLDLRGFVDSFDALVVASGRNDRQVRTLAEEVVRRVDAATDARPTHVEGVAEGEWIALDYGDVIVHVFDETDREYYDLEHLWAAPARRPARLP